MTCTDEDPLTRYVSAAADTLGIPLDPAWQPAVRQNLEATIAFAALVEEFPLPDQAEPAAIFRT